MTEQKDSIKTSSSRTQDSESKTSKISGSAYHSMRKHHPLDHVYVNPNVTKQGQKKLAEILHREIEAEDDFKKSFLERKVPTRPRNPNENPAKIFDEFCSNFLEDYKTKKESSNISMEVAQKCQDQLESLLSEHERIERDSYKFQLGLL